MNHKDRSDLVNTPPEFRVPASNPELGSRADRLRRAVKLAGGNLAVARQAGVPLGTLNKYIAGRELPADNLVALADACGVSVEWLATGRGEMLSEAKRKLLGVQLHAESADGTHLAKTPEFRRLIEEHPELDPDHRKPAQQRPESAPTNYASRSLFATVSVDRLAMCFDLVETGFQKHGIVPTTSNKVRLALLMYDATHEGNSDFETFLKDVIAISQKRGSP